jgi:Zn-dependent M16 (insulinase) family peptidase
MWTPTLDPVNEGLIIPAQVNYVGKGADLSKLGYTPHGSIVPIVNFLQATWLWERVRVQGGAYGAFATFDRRSGAFSFLSYRDPNVLSTLDNYDQSAQFLRQLDLPREELVKSLVGAIGLLDTYQLPDAKGYSSMTRHLTRDTDEGRQQMRDEILATTVDDFHRFGDVLDALNANGTVVVLGSQDAIDQANAAREGWLRTQKVL